MVLCELSNQLLIVLFVVNYEPFLIAGLELVCYSGITRPFPCVAIWQRVGTPG